MVVGSKIEEKKVFLTTIRSGVECNDGVEDECEILTLESGCSKVEFGFSALTWVKDIQGLLVRHLPVVAIEVKQALMNARKKSNEMLDRSKG